LSRAVFVPRSDAQIAELWKKIDFIPASGSSWPDDRRIDARVEVLDAVVREAVPLSDEEVASLRAGLSFVPKEGCDLKQGMETRGKFSNYLIMR
jgi:hypothetical protein